MSSKRKNEDRLSHLPEEVLSHILSLMPTELAVRTSILSKRFRYTWNLVTNLDFNDYHLDYRLNHFSKFVDRVLEHCKTSQLKLFHLVLCRSSVQKSNVSKWIHEAVRLNVCELHVIVSDLELPLSLFTCKTLTKLSLVGRQNDSEDFIVPSVVILPCLKTLCITLPGKASVAFRLINGCPMLESLYLVIGVHNEEEDFNFNIPTLKRLTLRTNGCIYINKVVLNVPNLEYLYVGGVLCSLVFVIEDLSSLVKAKVSFYSDDGKLNHLNAELLKGISGAKSLSWIFPSALDVLLKSPMPKFPNLKHLKVTGSLHSHSLLFFQHLESSCKLEHLCFKEPKISCWIEPESVPTWMLTNLKTMKIVICKGQNCDLQLMEYVLANAEVLKRLTITCERFRMKDEMEMCARLLTFPRASRCCQIHFVGKWCKST